MAQHNPSPDSLDASWVLLDSQSTMSVFSNPALLSNIRPADHPIRAITNGGFQDSTMVGDFHGLGIPYTAWYNPASIANILSLASIRKLCPVTMDSSKAPSISVHRPDGSLMTFDEHPCGLYVHQHNPSSVSPAHYTLLSSVKNNKRLFTQRQIQQAHLARKLYRMLGRPDEKYFRDLLSNNLIINCPISPDDALRALRIYGPDVATLKGKMTRATAALRAPQYQAITVPAPILEHHSHVTLCIDFFFVQGHAFLHTISRDINYRTVLPVSDSSASTITKELRRIIHLYTERGFHVTDIHGDHEFESVRSSVAPIHLNIVAADGHVGEVERSIRTIKERFRTMAHGLPFRRLPILLLRSMVEEAVRCLNLFPWPAGISSTLSPSSIVTGEARPDYTTMKIEFGAYAQLFDDVTPSNTPHTRSFGAIALGPTGNAQGAYHFLSLASGARVSCHRWTELPITDSAIARVEALALHQGQPLLQLHNLVVEPHPDHPIDPSEYDANYQPLPSHTAPDDDDLSVSSFLAPMDASELDDLNNDSFPPDVLPGAPPGEEHGTPHGTDQGAPPGNDHGAPPGVDNTAILAPAPGAPPPAPHSPPTLRPRTGSRVSFASAMDSPHSSTSYYPPAKAYQFFQYLPPNVSRPTSPTLTFLRACPTSLTVRDMPFNSFSPMYPRACPNSPNHMPP